MGEMGGGSRKGIFFPVIPFYIICKFLYRTLCDKNSEIAKTQRQPQKQHQKNHQTTKSHQNQQTTTKTKATEHQDYRGGGKGCLHFISFIFCMDCEQAKAPLKWMLEKTLERTLLASLKFLPTP